MQSNNNRGTVIKTWKLGLVLFAALIIGLLVVVMTGRSKDPKLNAENTVFEEPVHQVQDTSSGKESTSARVIADQVPASSKEPEHGDWYRGVPQHEELIQVYEKWSADEIQSEIVRIDALFEKDNLIAKANQGTLNKEGRQQLAKLMRERESLHLVKLEREIDAAETELEN